MSCERTNVSQIRDLDEKMAQHSGLVVREATLDRMEAFIAEYDFTILVEESGWVATRCFKIQKDGNVRAAHSSPIFIEIEDHPQIPKQLALEFLAGLCENLIQSSLQDGEKIALYQEAKEYYQSLLTSN